MGGSSLLFISFANVGYAGVDIFFVISGFVSAHTTLNKTHSIFNAWTFAKRRLLRIYLGYWPFLGINLVLTLQYFPETLSNLDFVSSFFLTSIDLKRLALSVTWSLTFELLFYAIVMASFALSTRVVKLCVHICSACLFLILIWTYRTPHSPLLLFLSMFLEFLTGVLVYIHRKRLENRWWIGPCLIVAFVAFVTGAHLHATDGSVRIFTFGTGALALVMLVLTLEQSRTLITSKIWIALGDASYTLYLVHLSLLVVFYFWGIRDFLASQPALLRETGFFLFLGLCIWISRMLYLWIEAPLYRRASGSHASGCVPPQPN
jgi:peptidoglycan/LPS O-acetylase OafA/YrhL